MFANCLAMWNPVPRKTTVQEMTKDLNVELVKWPVACDHTL
jgi:hypothetical protein